MRPLSLNVWGISLSAHGHGSGFCCLSELCRQAACVPLEELYEIRRVVKAEAIAYLLDAPARLAQLPFGIKHDAGDDEPERRSSRTGQHIVGQRLLGDVQQAGIVSHLMQMAVMMFHQLAELHKFKMRPIAYLQLASVGPTTEPLHVNQKEADKAFHVVIVGKSRLQMGFSADCTHYGA
jgi:hypothetical protein